MSLTSYLAAQSRNLGEWRASEDLNLQPSDP